MGVTERISESVNRRLRRRLRFRRMMAGSVATSYVDIPVRGLPSGLQGFRIVHISDLHIGAGMWEPEHAADAALVVRDARPDIVVNTGDFIQDEPRWDKVTSLVSQFALPQAETPYAPANLAILGNHDYYLDDATVNQLTEHLEAIGLTMLVNRATCVIGPAGSITFAGLSEDAPGFDEAVQHLREAGRPRVVLVHEPEVAEHLPEDTADLILAGHTHGGQITLPGLELAIVKLFCGSHYVNGLYRVNSMPLWINRGLGCTGIPLRFRAAPEVTVLTLVR